MILSLISTFVDFRKAFDQVNVARMSEILCYYGIPEKPDIRGRAKGEGLLAPYV